MPRPRPSAQQRAVLAQHQALQQSPPEAHRHQQAQLPAPFEHVAQDHHAQPRAAEQQAQPAQHLERAQVGVLHGVELVQPPRRGRQLQAGVLQRARQRGGDLRDGVRRRIHQEHPVAALAREPPGELGLVNQQAPLQDRVRHRAHQPQLERAPLLVRVINRVADLLAQRPLDGVGVADGGNLVGDCRSADLRIAGIVSQSL